MNAYKTLNSKKIYQGKIFDIYKDEITLPDNKTAIREYISHLGAVAILPIDADGNIIFVRQYRHPAKSMVLELPAGSIDKGEEPLQCGIRELEEETGFKSNHFTFLFQMYSAVGFCNEILYIYLAENLEKGHTNLDPEEFIELEVYSLSQAIEMIFSGEIIDSKTIAGILAYKELLTRKK